MNNEVADKMLRDAIRKQGSTRAEILERTGFDAETLRNALARGRTAGRIYCEGRTVATRWFVR